MNAAWHRAHPMPPRATLAERAAWHVAHAERCGCRPAPESVRHAAVYHNPERMGYSVAGYRRACFLTNKHVTRGAVGTRVWLLTGEGRPRRYFLRGTFTVARFESAADEGFRWRVWGRDARYFVPMLDVTDAEWFDPFRRSQGSFAFGWQSIADARFVRALEGAAAGAAWAPADREA